MAQTSSTFGIAAISSAREADHADGQHRAEPRALRRDGGSALGLRGRVAHVVDARPIWAWWALDRLLSTSRGILSGIRPMAPGLIADAESDRDGSTRRPRSSAAPTSAHSARPWPAAAAWVPRSTITPPSSTRISCASTTVESRCAITSVVLFCAALLQLGLDRALVGRVQRRGRLVEDQDRRVLQQRARDRHALLLAARELEAALAHRGLVALGRGGDEVVDARRPRRLPPPRRGWRPGGRRRCCIRRCR